MGLGLTSYLVTFAFKKLHNVKLHNFVCNHLKKFRLSFGLSGIGQYSLITKYELSPSFFVCILLFLLAKYLSQIKTEILLTILTQLLEEETFLSFNFLYNSTRSKN